MISLTKCTMLSINWNQKNTSGAYVFIQAPLVRSLDPFFDSIAQFANKVMF